MNQIFIVVHVCFPFRDCIWIQTTEPGLYPHTQYIPMNNERKRFKFEPKRFSCSSKCNVRLNKSFLYPEGGPERLPIAVGVWQFINIELHANETTPSWRKKTTYLIVYIYTLIISRKNPLQLLQMQIYVIRLFC